MDKAMSINPWASISHAVTYSNSRCLLHNTNNQRKLAPLFLGQCLPEEFSLLLLATQPSAATLSPSPNPIPCTMGQISWNTRPKGSLMELLSAVNKGQTYQACTNYKHRWLQHNLTYKQCTNKLYRGKPPAQLLQILCAATPTYLTYSNDTTNGFYSDPYAL